MGANAILRGSGFSVFVLPLALGASPAAEQAGCPCWTFADLSREFLDDANDFYCITNRFETEIISRRPTGPTRISSASVMPQLFNDPGTGRCNASFENVGLFNSSFVEDPFAIEACLDDLDRLRELRPCL
jgi:hypothetical protein